MNNSWKMIMLIFLPWFFKICSSKDTTSPKINLNTTLKYNFLVCLYILLEKLPSHSNPSSLTQFWISLIFSIAKGISNKLCSLKNVFRYFQIMANSGINGFFNTVSAIRPNCPSLFASSKENILKWKAVRYNFQVWSIKLLILGRM